MKHHKQPLQDARPEPSMQVSKLKTTLLSAPIKKAHQKTFHDPLTLVKNVLFVNRFLSFKLVWTVLAFLQDILYIKIKIP